MPIGSTNVYNPGDLILSTVSGSGTSFIETKIIAATSSFILFNSSGTLTSASLNSIVATTSSYVSGSTSIITNLTASNISASGTSSFGMVGIGTTSPAFLLDVSGSSRHGYRAADTHQFTGSVNISGSLNATASWASNALTASWASNALTASSLVAANSYTITNLTAINISASVYTGSSAYFSNIGFSNQTVASDTSIFPTGSTSGGLILDGGVYTNGLYRTRFVKIDRSANLSLYIQETKGSSGSFSNLARFGTHANSPNTFEVFGSTNIQGSITSSNFVGPLIGNTTGTASWSTNALTASFLPVGTYNITSSWSTNALTASSLVAANSYTITNLTASTISASGAIIASSFTGSFSGSIGTAVNATSASYALTSSYISPSGNSFVQGGNSFGTTAVLGTNDAQPLALETNGTTRMSINNNGNVAINTSTSELVRLNISDTHRGSLGSSSLYIDTIQNQNQGLATSANDSGITNAYYVNNFTSSAAIQNQAIFNQLYINGSGSFSGSYRASRNAINISNTASLDINGNIINTYLTNQISANIPTFSINNWIAGTSTYVDLITGNSTGSITNLYQHQIGSPFPSGGVGGITVNNSYGVYINKQKTTNIVTNGWGIYQVDTGDLNIFAGKTRIGSTTVPVNALDVTGNISASVVTASLFFGTASFATTASSLVAANSYTVTNLTASNALRAAKIAEKVVTFTPLTGSLTGAPAWYRIISGSGVADYGRVRLSTTFDNSRSDLEFTYGVRNYDINGAGAFINITRASTYNSVFSAVRVIEGTLTDPYAIDVLIGNYLNNTTPDTVTCLYESQFIGAVLDTPTFVSASATGSNSNVVKTVYVANSALYPIIGPVYSDGLSVATYQGQLTVGYRGNYNYSSPSTNNYALLVSGSVGIGTTSPGEKLTVSGSSYIIGGTGAVGTGTAYYLGGSNKDISLTRVDAATLAIGRYYPSAWAETIRFTADGNVGIGTSNPTAKLQVGTQVFGSAPDANYFVVGNNDFTGAGPVGAVNGYPVTANRNQVTASIFDVVGGWERINGSHALLRVSAYDVINSTPALTVLNNGNVGIGTPNPLGKLHITGSTTASENLLYLSKGSGSITQHYINAVDQLGQLNYRVSSDINGHAQQTLYFAGTAHVYHDSYWSSYINNANYTQGGLGIGTSSVIHGYGLAIARPATSGSLYVSGSSVFTGSVNISGSVTFSGPIIYDNAVLLDYGNVSTPVVSTNYVVLQNLTGSYNSAFFDYFASSGSNFRAGTLIAGWSGNNVNYTEYSTTDVGNTNQLSMSVDLSGSFVRLLTTVSTTINWNIKTAGRYL